MKIFSLLPFAVLFVVGANAIDWGKFDAARLAAYGPKQSAPPVVEEGSGVEPKVEPKVPVAVVPVVATSNTTNAVASNATTVAATNTTTTTTAAPTTTTEAIVENEKCDNGWYRYQDSCYFIERNTKATVKDAQAKCNAMESTLFAADNSEEYKAIMAQTPTFDFTWAGLFKDTDTRDAVWQAPTNFDFKELNWLIKPYNSVSNGWHSGAKCAGHYNGNIDAGRYTYYYSCDYKFYFICERNSNFLYTNQ